MGKSLLELATDHVAIINKGKLEAFEQDRDGSDGFIEFTIPKPTKNDPDRMLHFQLDIQYLGDDY